MIHHEGAQCDTWECHASVKSIPHRVLVVVGDVSGKQGETIWGLGAVTSDLHGTIVWEGQAWMDLMHGRTDVLEATAVVEACRAIHRATSTRGESVDLVLAFCDNKGAATAPAHHTLTHRGGNLMDRTVCDFYDLAQSMPLRMGWCPAQHDTQLQGVLAMANKAADTKAKRAQRHREGSHWTMPQAWVAGHTFAWYHKGRRVMGIKRMVRDSMVQAPQCRQNRGTHQWSMCRREERMPACDTSGLSVHFAIPETRRVPCWRHFLKTPGTCT